jgi:hypothetical protein
MNAVKLVAAATAAFWLFDTVLFGGANFEAISTMLGLILTGMTHTGRW